MPKELRLFNQHITVEKIQELDRKSTPDQPVARDAWTMIFTDKTYGDRILITFTRETRDQIVRLLTGGVVLAGGDFPKV